METTNFANDLLATDLRTASAKTTFSVPFLRNEIRAGKLKAHKRGSKVYILIEDLKEYLRSAPSWGDSNGDDTN